VAQDSLMTLQSSYERDEDLARDGCASSKASHSHSWQAILAVGERTQLFVIYMSLQDCLSVLMTCM
jgi:hypothetical protein